MPDPAANGAALYRQVHATLRAELAAGAPPVGQSLPSEAALAQRFAVSRITIRHALDLLAAEGVIRKAKARRAVVAAREPARGWVAESLADIASQADDAVLELRSWRRERMPAEAAQFGLPGSATLPCLRGVLRRGGAADAHVVICFPPEIGARLKRRDFDDPVVFRVMQRVLGLALADVEITVSAAAADAADAALLGCRRGAPLLVTRLAYHDDSGRLVELAQARGLAARARFATRLSAKPPPRDA